MFLALCRRVQTFKDTYSFLAVTLDTGHLLPPPSHLVDTDMTTPTSAVTCYDHTHFCSDVL